MVIKITLVAQTGVVKVLSPPQAIRYSALAFLFLYFEIVNGFSQVSKLPRLFTKVEFKFSGRSFEFSFYKLNEYKNIICDF